MVFSALDLLQYNLSCFLSSKNSSCFLIIHCTYGFFKLWGIKRKIPNLFSHFKQQWLEGKISCHPIQPLRLELPVCSHSVSSHSDPPQPSLSRSHPGTVASVENSWDKKREAWTEVLSCCICVKLVRSCTELVPQQWLAYEQLMQNNLMSYLKGTWPF